MTTLRRATVALCASAAIALAACSGTGEGSGGSSAKSVTLGSLAQAPTVLPDGSPSAVSVAVSQTLVKSSPVVVLGEAGTASEAMTAAASIGVPLLIVDEATPAGQADPSAAPTETAAPPQTPSGTDAPDAVAAEVKRLGATKVVALGRAAEAEAKTLPGVEVTTSATKAGKVTKAEPATGTAVLTTATLPAPDAKEVDPLTAASTGTATAIKATVVSAPTGDPRASAESVTTISEHKPTKIVAVGSAFGTPEQVSTRVASAATGVQLPGGGQLIAPNKLYIAVYGHPNTPSLGVFGEQDLEATITRAREFAEPYKTLTPATVVPTFEIITTVATQGAGEDGNYSNEVDPELIRPYIERAQQEGIYVMLDLQSGQDTPLNQAKRYETLLTYPNVGLAIDPEWKLKPGQRHLTQIGQVDASEVNPVLDYLAELTRTHNLPQKAVILHQFQLRMVTNRDQVTTSHEELQLIIHVDGHGVPAEKRGEYLNITKDAPAGIVFGWKNFIDEDRPMFTPEQTMKETPTPTMVSYQ